MSPRTTVESWDELPGSNVLPSFVRVILPTILPSLQPHLRPVPLHHQLRFCGVRTPAGGFASWFSNSSCDVLRDGRLTYVRVPGIGYVPEPRVRLRTRNQ
jgi:hypothetical protein